MLRDTSAAVAVETEARELPPAPAVPAFTKPSWWDDELDVNRRDGRLQAIVKAFVTGTMKGRMNGEVGNGRHFYTARKNGTELWIFKDNPRVKLNICIAKKVNGYFVGNASSIMAIRQANNGKLNWVGGAQKIQEILSDVMPMVPFRLFKDAQLDINSFHVIDKAPDEMIDVGRRRNGKNVLTHYTGAMVFKIEVNPRSRGIQGKSARYFLFDIDRNDLALKNFNAFLSELRRPVTSIADAYDSLKPDEVRNAERFMKRPCERQGEWFFIPVQGRFKRKTESTTWSGARRRGRHPFVEACLQSKGNRPHYVQFLSEEGYVTGKVRHGGHEHKPIILKGWHKPVPNAAVESFKISGAID